MRLLNTCLFVLLSQRVCESVEPRGVVVSYVLFVAVPLFGRVCSRQGRVPIYPSSQSKHKVKLNNPQLPSARILSLCLATVMVMAQSASLDAPVANNPSPLESVADVPSNMAEVSVISSAAPPRSIQTAVQSPIATSSPSADLNIESLILSLTPSATACLTQLQALMEQLNIDSSSSLSDEAVALSYFQCLAVNIQIVLTSSFPQQKNRNHISTCAVSCNSTVLSTIAATCATVGGLGGAGAGSSPIPTVRSATAFSDAVSNLELVPLLLGVVGMLVL